MATDNVVSLSGAPPTQSGVPRDELIGVLKDLLERAERGELQSFIGCGFTSAGLRISAWVDLHEDVYQMLGSLAWLQHEYVESHTHGA